MLKMTYEKERVKYEDMKVRIKEQKLDAFVRYEQYDTHAATQDAEITRNLGYNRQEWTAGLSYHIANGAVVKADYQILDNAIDGNEAKGQLNVGFGVWF